jgi:hypothetical protein
MEKKTKKTEERKQLLVKVITDRGEGDAFFEKEVNHFLARQDVEVQQTRYVFRNNANVCYVEYYNKR